MHLFARIPARERRTRRHGRAPADPGAILETPSRRSKWRPGAACLAWIVCLLLASGASAQEAAPAAGSGAEIEALRAEVKELREQVLALQQQVQALLSARTGAAPQGPEAPGVPPPEPPAPPPAEPPPAPPAVAPPAKSPSLLNPAISAVFQLIGSSFAHQDEVNGFDLSEAEVAFQSVVDPYAKMDLFLTFPVDESPEVEEGTVTTLTLPYSLQLKGGRYKNAFGKWNPLHTHAFFTVERPVALTDYFGEESLTTDGLSLSWLIPNPGGLYLESTSEVGTAREGPSFNSAGHSLTYAQRFAAFFTASADATLEIGLGGVWGKTGPSEALLSAIDDAGLSGTLEPDDQLNSRVYGWDATYKWKPLTLNTYRSLLWQTELLLSQRRTQELTPALTLAERRIASLGGYSYFEWQFAKRLRGGLRLDFSDLPESETARQTGIAAVLRWIPSEFQELRFQINRVQRNDAAAALLDRGEDDTRIFFEWIPVIGAHGAHKY
jgi:hypothetical protein